MAVILACMAPGGTARAQTLAQDDARLVERTTTLPRDNLVLAVDWFEPKALLTPSPDPVELVEAERTAGDFAEAIAYSDAKNSTALLIWQGGKLQLERYGPGADRDTLTQSQSMHKSVVAIMVGIALDDGAIASLDDPVSNYLGEWIAQPHGQITLRHLLTMTSGLQMRPVGETGLEAFGNRLYNSSDIDAVARSSPQVRPPGEVFEYNNVNPQLLVAVLEAATGQAYEDYLSERLWTRIAEDPGYLWLDREDGIAHGYCCLIATARDWLRLGHLLLEKGSVDGEEIVSADQVVAALDASSVNPNYGQLIWRGSPYREKRNYRPEGVYPATHSESYRAPDVFFFDGFGGQRVYIVPSRDLVIVRTGPEVYDWDDAFLPNRVIEALDAQVRASLESDCLACPQMVPLSAGTVRLGSDEAEAVRYNVPAIYAERERPITQVSIAKPFAISRTEVTNLQFARFIAETGYKPGPGCWKFLGNQWEFDSQASWQQPGVPSGAHYPVTCVNALDGEAYAQWLSQTTGRSYRLPSEAEWEYAARANRPGTTYWNDSMSDLCRFANPGDRSTERAYEWEQLEPLRSEYGWRGAACDDGFAGLAPVASFSPNPFGLYDMIGNVNEWTADCFTPTHEGRPTSQEPRREADCEFRLLKGHTWTGNERTSRPAFRLRLEGTDRRFNLGFRVIRTD